MLHSFRFLLFVLSASTALWANCTFSNLVVSRDTTGTKLSANPSVDQCDILPTTVSLDVYNLYNNNSPSRILTYTQVIFQSGPRSIVINGSGKAAGSVVSKAYIHDTVSARFDAEGDYYFTATVGGGPSASSQTIQVRVGHLTVSPSQIDIATGGVANNILSTSSTLLGQPRLSWSLLDNTAGESSATVNVDAQGRVSASTNRQSGIFGLSASVATFNKYAQITVPPQPLIQVIIGEAQAQGDNAKIAVAGIVRNRLNNSLFGRLSTYNALIFAKNQFSSISTSRFLNAQSRNTAESQPKYDSAVAAAAQVFDRRVSAPFAQAIGFGSPGASNALGSQEVAKLTTELNRSPCKKVSATTLGFATYWYKGTVEFPSIQDQQIVVFNEVPSVDFAFFRARPSGACAVVKQSWNQQ